MSLIRLEDPTTQRIAPNTFMLFALGFRPFYLAGALFAAVAMAAWIAALGGTLISPLASVLWHGHEMLFGFAVAIIVGFLFTAGKVWTGLRTPTGGALLALVLLWLAGRVAMAVSVTPLASVIDAAFLPVCALIFMRLLLRSGSQRNYFIGALLLVLSLANIGFHLALHEVIALSPLTAIHLAMALILVLETIIAGRVVPMFTASALRGVRQWRNKGFDYASIALTAAALLIWILNPGVIAGWIALLAAVMQMLRSLGWNPLATWKNPLLWILHLAHFWIPVGLALVAAANWDWVPRSAAIHALTIGSMGGLIIGMITRTALGHTGRKLIAGPVETFAYVLVQLAAFVRVVSVVALPTLVVPAIHLAATAWMLAFGVYFVRYLPMLWRARADGRPD